MLTVIDDVVSNMHAEHVLSIGSAHGWKIHFDLRGARRSKCIIDAPQGTLILVQQDDTWPNATFEVKMASKFNQFEYVQRIKAYFSLLGQRTSCGMENPTLKMGLALKDLEPFVKLEQEWAFLREAAIQTFLSSNLEEWCHGHGFNRLESLVLIPEFSFTDSNVRREVALSAAFSLANVFLNIFICYNGQYKKHIFATTDVFNLFKTTTLLKSLYGENPEWSWELLRDIQLQFHTERNLISTIELNPVLAMEVYLGRTHRS